MQRPEDAAGVQKEGERKVEFTSDGRVTHDCAYVEGETEHQLRHRHVALRQRVGDHWQHGGDTDGDAEKCVE